MPLLSPVVIVLEEKECFRPQVHTEFIALNHAEAVSTEIVIYHLQYEILKVSFKTDIFSLILVFGKC